MKRVTLQVIGALLLVGLALLPSTVWGAAFQAEALELNLDYNGTGYGRVALADGGWAVLTSTFFYHGPTTGGDIFGVPGVRDAVIDGRNGGAWNGNVAGGPSGITPSQYNATTAPFYAIGYAENTGDTLSTLNLASFGGLNATNTPAFHSSTLVRQTWQGDANMDGTVNSADYIRWLNAYTAPTPPSATWAAGDFNYDGVVNSADYILWLNAYTAPTALGSLGSSGSGGLSTVPEPSTFVLLSAIAGLVGFFVAWRRASATVSSK